MILAELALTPPYYLVLSALMFAIGATGLLEVIFGYTG